MLENVKYFRIKHQLKNTLNILVVLIGSICVNLIRCPSKMFKIQLNETAVFHQLLLSIMHYQT